MFFLTSMSLHCLSLLSVFCFVSSTLIVPKAIKLQPIKLSSLFSKSYDWKLNCITMTCIGDQAFFFFFSFLMDDTNCDLTWMIYILVHMIVNDFNGSGGKV